ncbi:hypothetical protein ACFU3O_03210 [Streptomyces antibioticus]|uniref:hypothetical protein n=1 Tax=Streptomyces antibioticus TaxID=1890 RepID=UPI00368551BB
MAKGSRSLRAPLRSDLVGRAGPDMARAERHRPGVTLADGGEALPGRLRPGTWAP